MKITEIYIRQVNTLDLYVLQAYARIVLHRVAIHVLYDRTHLIQRIFHYNKHIEQLLYDHSTCVSVHPYEYSIH